MDVIDFVGRLSGVFNVVLIFFVGWYVKFYLPGYFKKKGENLATKEDVAAITHEIEGVKNHYAQAMEKYKDSIWQGQQREIWLKEEFKFRLDIYKRAITLVYNYLESIKSYHVAHLSSGVNEAIYCHLEREGGELKERLGESYRLEYESTNVKTLEWYSKCKDVELELREVLGVVEVYFDDQLSECLDALIEKGVDAARTYCDPGGFFKSVEKEWLQSFDYRVVSLTVVRDYFGLFQKLVPEDEAKLCLEKLKISIVRSRENILALT